MKLWGCFVCLSCDFPSRVKRTHTSQRTCVRHLVSSPRGGHSTPPLCPCFLHWCFIGSYWRGADGRRLFSSHVCWLLWFVTDLYIISQKVWQISPISSPLWWTPECSKRDAAFASSLPENGQIKRGEKTKGSLDWFPPLYSKLRTA